MKRWQIALIVMAVLCFALGALFSPESAAVLVVIGIPVTVVAYRRRLPMAIVLPVVFAVIAAPFAIYVASGQGGHMTPLLLEPFASPWDFIPFSEYPPGFEIRLLLTGCAINTILLGIFGFALDQRPRRRSE